jgi:hypothetical protein
MSRLLYPSVPFLVVVMMFLKSGSPHALPSGHPSKTRSKVSNRDNPNKFPLNKVISDKSAELGGTQ